MSRHFSATLLLDHPWALDVDAIASVLRTQFPGIGEVDSLPGPSDGTDTGVLVVEGATVMLQSVPVPLSPEDLNPPLKPLRAAGIDDVIATHQGQLVVSARGVLPGLEWAEAYAALVHFVAAAAMSVCPASAVFWKTGWAIARPETFMSAANMLLAGKMPVGTWVSFATIVPQGVEQTLGMGMVTYGMQDFVGRELELAPRPGSPRGAFQTISTVCRTMLDTGLRPQDGDVLDDSGGDRQLIVRDCDYWLRQDQAALVLVSGDAIVDADTLKVRPEFA